MNRFFWLILLLLACAPVNAAPAVRLILTNDECLFQICPPTRPPPATTVVSGSAFQVFVIAVDGSGLRDPNYAGTLNFASTDSLASLPSTYTFVPSDQGRREFTVVLHSVGSQTVTVADPVNNLAPGTLALTVGEKVVAESIPMSSGLMRMILVLGLALCAILLLGLSA